MKNYEDEEDLLDDDEDSDDSECCDDCGGYHGHNPWCSEYDASYTGEDEEF